MSGSVSAGFTGYPNQVFQVCTISAAWLSNLLQNTSDPTTLSQQAANVYQTLINGRDAVSAYQLQSAWQTELSLLQQVQVLPLFLPQAQSQAFNARISALQQAITALQSLIPAVSISNAISTLQNNQPAIDYPGVLEFYQAFAYESSPSGFAASQVSLYAAEAAANWAAIAGAVFAYQTTSSLTQAYDECTRTAAALNQVADILNQLQSPPNNQTFKDFGVTSPLLDTYGNLLLDTYGNILYDTLGGSGVAFWNQIVTLPALLLSGSSIYSSPSSNLNQQAGVIRYMLNQNLNTLSSLILAFKTPQNNTYPQLATIKAGDSLQDIAARVLGDFEQWTQIAALNGLNEPWVGISGSQPGDKLILPSSSGTVNLNTPLTNYDVDILGVDWFYGPLGAPMLNWTGDVPLVAGSSNLQISLVRRILTTINDLIYHPTYGSRIPPQVGQVMDTYTQQNITAYGQSALLSDPRVQSVISASTTLNAKTPSGTNYGLVSFTGTVQPIGLNGNGIEINAVFS